MERRVMVQVPWEMCFGLYYDPESNECKVRKVNVESECSDRRKSLDCYIKFRELLIYWLCALLHLEFLPPSSVVVNIHTTTIHIIYHYHIIRVTEIEK